MYDCHWAYFHDSHTYSTTTCTKRPTEFHKNPPTLCVDIRSHERNDVRGFRLKHLLLRKEYLRIQRNATAQEHSWNILEVLIDVCMLSCYEVGSVGWPFVHLARVMRFLADTESCGLS